MTDHTSGSSHDESSVKFSMNTDCAHVRIHRNSVGDDGNSSNKDVTDISNKPDLQMEDNEKTNDNTIGLLTESIEVKPAGVDEVHCLTKLQIMKNLFIVCSSFFLMFTSFHSLQNLQSSLNKEEGVGTFSLVIVYVSMVTSSMFLSSVFIHRLGMKLTMCVSMTMYILYMAANLYPVWGIMVPTALLCGLAAAPLWASQSSYLSQLSRYYAKANNMKPKDAISYLFGIFYMCVNASKITGNLLAALVLKQDDRGNSSMTAKEIEDCMTNKQEAVENATTLVRPDDTTIYAMCGTWIGLGIIGIIVMAFLTSLPRYGNKDEKRKPICSKFTSTMKHFWDSRLQKLLIPLSLHYGIVCGFLVADFTKSIVGCTSGIQAVGDVMLCHAISNTLMSAIIGRLVKHLGHLPFFTFTFLCYGVVQITFVIWKPGPDYSYLFFIFAAMWGAADAILKTQVLAIYGHLFPENTEAAYGNYFVCEGTGFIISFSYSTVATTDVKLYILLVLLLCSAISYYSVEYISRRQITVKEVVELEHK
ncbi:protein unc-93 homolog A-like [Argopecten irradians]|uniref:protein unc-93 homolog A-like n=1 Tax=Argopecten irradians TaxID=31199 RepID=UPI0037100481